LELHGNLVVGLREIADALTEVLRNSAFRMYYRQYGSYAKGVKTGSSDL
jgi:hypothetical protein